MTKPRLLVLVATAALVLPACTLAQAEGGLGQLQSVHKTCPGGMSVAGYAADDVSQNSRSTELSAERLQEIKGLATFTATCGGSLEVVAFSASDAGTETLYSGQLKPAGATLNARLRKVPATVNQVMKTITTALPEAVASLPPDATDVLAQFTLMAEFARQLGSGYRLYGDVLTSGLQTTGVVVTNVNFTDAAAVDLATRVPMPSLPGSVITIARVGRVASGAPAPSGYVQALTDFYSKACSRTGATCTVVTNPAITGS